MSEGNANAILKRGFLALEDGEWDKADSFFENVLNYDAENAHAYLGKLMVELRIKNQQDLADCAYPFDKRNNFIKAIRFGDENLKNTLYGYISHINERNENKRVEKIYAEAVAKMNSAKWGKEYIDAKDLFLDISNYKDAATLAIKCEEKADEARKDTIYLYAKSAMSLNSVEKQQEAIANFKKVENWRDSKEQIEVCNRKIEAIRKKEEEDRIAKEKLQKEKKIKAAKIFSKIKKITSLSVIIIVALAILIVILKMIVLPNIKYNKAVKCVANKEYNEAIGIFIELDDFKDSEVQIKETTYKKALNCMEMGKYQKCVEILSGIIEYKDAKTQITEAEYRKALKFMENGEYLECVQGLSKLGRYKESIQKIEEAEKMLFKTAEVGDIILFGEYEQDYNLDNGKEAIEWIVLDKKGDDLFLLSNYALDCKQFNTNYGNVIWSTSYLREWLNSTFIDSAFDSGEKQHLIESVIKCIHNNYDGSGPTEVETNDKVFLLNEEEAEQYLSETQLKCNPTEYVRAISEDIKEYGCCWWWYRSGNGIYGIHGYHGEYGFIDYGSVGDAHEVRPAMWVSVE